MYKNWRYQCLKIFPYQYLHHILTLLHHTFYSQAILEHLRKSNFKIFFNHGEGMTTQKTVKLGHSGAFQKVNFQNFLHLFFNSSVSKLNQFRLTWLNVKCILVLHGLPMVSVSFESGKKLRGDHKDRFKSKWPISDIFQHLLLEHFLRVMDWW